MGVESVPVSQQTVESVPITGFKACRVQQRVLGRIESNC